MSYRVLVRSGAAVTVDAEDFETTSTQLTFYTADKKIAMFQLDAISGVVDTDKASVIERNVI